MNKKSQQSRGALEAELAFFEEHGYLVVRHALRGQQLRVITEEFERAWELETKPVSQSRLLKYSPFIELIQHKPVMDRLRHIFIGPIQLLQADLGRQGPHHKGGDRYWHRDLPFPGDYPLAANVILYLDPMGEMQGPTRVVPASHRGAGSPPAEALDQPFPGEIAIDAEPGDGVIINAAVWHTGGTNRSTALRRTIYYYYGYWWLKRFDHQENGKHDVPWQALVGADDERLELLGVRMPDAGMFG